MESVTKKQVEEALTNVLIDKPVYIVYASKIVAELFPPEFTPKKGQIIAVWDMWEAYCAYVLFNCMENDKYQTLSGSTWKHARPLNNEELGK